ncbi:MFS general substrate transporter [Macrolepiota fuliginosa MF-IS2]|uniref:MFS general substrate transporter n=1 Tax=Macrolepiota fuliginosa MF-IS2 TaxID=1400762 RepID=A0A9P5X730_9AGAR|nr:MFS general substrate transporter [Macrolepiota fuliginosa MF-IS2]
MSIPTDERQPLLGGSDDLKKQPPGPREISRSNRFGILAGVWMATFLSAFNQTLVPTMLASISSEFNKSNQASWLGTAYLLATCTFTPLYGRLCNVLGRQGAHATALLFAAAGCMMCGLSRSMEMLIMARFLAGMGGGGLFTTSSIVVSDMYSIRSRGLAQGVASVFNGLGLGLGGPFGGMITDWLGWRWAFLIQIPFFFVSYFLTSYHLRYVTPGKGKSTKEMLKRIDYGGSVTLLISVGSVLFFLSEKYNKELPWDSLTVMGSLVSALVSAIAFVITELYISPEPILAPNMLGQKIPMLSGASNFLVANCNFAIMYFFPLWFQTVRLTNASTAGAHLLPNSMAMSTGSLFAGYVMHKTGKYKLLNLIFGFFPFIGAVGICLINENSGFIQSWFSIIPLGFGNAVVLQTMLIALLVHLPENYTAIGTGFNTFFRGIGQVGGVAIASAIYQARLDHELCARITGPGAAELIARIRHQATIVATLPPEFQRPARDAFNASLKAVFIYAACSTFLAFCVRLPIPEKDLDSRPPAVESPQPPAKNITLDREEEDETVPPSRASETETVAVEDDEVDDLLVRNNGDLEVGVKRVLTKKRSRRLSGFESQYLVADPEAVPAGPHRSSVIPT